MMDHKFLNAQNIFVLLLSAFIIAPIAAVFLAAMGDSGGLWQHLVDTVLWKYIKNTIILSGGVAFLATVTAVSTAWLVARYDFFCKNIVDWMLLLPMAVPAYLVAYTYTDFFEYAGPMQQGLRHLFGWENAQDYWFPEIRSMGGAILVLSSVLYPYIYTLARTSFRTTSMRLIESAEIYNKNTFFYVAVPIARPAIVAGLSLVLMETVSDFGTVEYFAVDTLTLGIFNIWLGMDNLVAASQIASIASLVIFLLLYIELLARSKRRIFNSPQSSAELKQKKLHGIKSIMSFLYCLCPVGLGFFLPVGILLNFVIRGYSSDEYYTIFIIGLESVGFALIAASIIISLAVLAVLISEYGKNKILGFIVRVSTLGYAFPGTILAIGVVVVINKMDGFLHYIMGDILSLSYDGVIKSGFIALIFAYLVRFYIVGFGATTAGIGKFSADIANASRTLGNGFFKTLKKVTIPLIRGAVLTGFLLTFVDIMKELPLTLLLRPFNFETLATYIYQYAKDEMLEISALAGLGIVIAGMIPVLIINISLKK